MIRLQNYTIQDIEELNLKNIKLPKIIKFNEKLLYNVDVIFSALPNGEAQKISNFTLST